MKDTYYFSHDYNVRTDAKIKKLLAKHGYLGYGLFWAIIEDLYNNANALQTDYESIAFDLRSKPDTIKSIINDFDLFKFDGDTFGSSSVERRLNERNLKSEKARESAFNRWHKPKDDANALRTQSDGNAIKERKVNKKKVKETIIPPFSEFLSYAKETRPKISEMHLKSKYDAWIVNDWKDGNNNNIVNWKSKLLNTMPYLNDYNAKNMDERLDINGKPRPTKQHTLLDGKWMVL